MGTSVSYCQVYCTVHVQYEYSTVVLPYNVHASALWLALLIGSGVRWVNYELEKAVCGVRRAACGVLTMKSPLSLFSAFSRANKRRPNKAFTRTQLHISWASILFLKVMRRQCSSCEPWAGHWWSQARSSAVLRWQQQWPLDDLTQFVASNCCGSHRTLKTTILTRQSNAAYCRLTSTNEPWIR